MGCYYGAFFTKAGFDTELIARGAHLKAMQETGRLVFKSRIHGDSVIPVKAAGGLTGEYDVIIFAVKSQDTEISVRRCREAPQKRRLRCFVPERSGKPGYSGKALR
ncbi:MAG: 2-dehydropantoate 2-reductase [Geovibrio sp.]|nr:2-dehydropantoate 2-reductase [Geovibrio sp.]